MVAREGGALRGDNVLHVSHVAGDQIELPFADDGVTGVENGALGFIEAEEDLALREDGRFGRVDVLGSFLIARQDASAEADDTALLVADGKHQTTTEAVVVAVGFLFANN